MSRCFPYPPPGYVRRGVHSAALIESIKVGWANYLVFAFFDPNCLL
ncbi:hypothetical protein SLEP1_g4173 [Rubroshorea leprosula]|uniref:Uncharacterized protein n=1 Tax=Rubroshorea leprosula TaxID=152421 RepID=A0AAV5HWL6_9ROSI|nr:hypothetical protein SLEP1_g4173 [Rubroshorea leprosula]